MRSKKANEDYIIVDVRDDDFIGGNIVGCVRSPSSVFLSDVNGLVEKTKGIPKVVFHCMLSQARGPKSARIYAETSRNLHESEDKPTQEVLILRGGFSEFQAKYKASDIFGLYDHKSSVTSDVRDSLVLRTTRPL
ncbi:hypothetical protein BOTBODRAFT_506596 [Botryobasidium botryosum FD-172 SS1]|uniref:Rhodanese domain-containing protein n=1 Tax=Botryobasidium botryosum (strain FD-172 SS1) TaxID=930990 RepID=A0A067M2C4_BOTB1|nr:hypothetical protein BOTBODRAFT_506596 [Botryobasidium botryosum FD-172 SS1]